MSNNRKIILHGACNALNNITGWIGKDFDYVLVDNDDKKQGKLFFGKRVQSAVSVDLNNYDKNIDIHNKDNISMLESGHSLYYKNVIEVLRGEANPVTDGREGLKTLEILIAAYKSSRDGKTINLPLDYQK